MVKALNSLRMVIFDCDGTIVDSQRSLVDILQATFEHHDLPMPSRHKVLLGIGLELSVAIKRLAPKLDNLMINEICTTYRRYAKEYRKSDVMPEPLYPNAQEVIMTLHKNGWLLGIATGKSRQGLDYVLDNYNLGECFISKQTSDSAPGKPNPEMIYQAMQEGGVEKKNVIMVGDTTYDIDMAVNAGVKSVGVTWGYHDKEDLEKAGAYKTVDEFRDLLLYLEKYQW